MKYQTPPNDVYHRIAARAGRRIAAPLSQSPKFGAGRPQTPPRTIDTPQPRNPTHTPNKEPCK